MYAAHLHNTSSRLKHISISKVSYLQFCLVPNATLYTPPMPSSSQLVLVYLARLPLYITRHPAPGLLWAVSKYPLLWLRWLTLTGEKISRIIQPTEPISVHCLPRPRHLPFGGISPISVSLVLSCSGRGWRRGHTSHFTALARGDPDHPPTCDWIHYHRASVIRKDKEPRTLYASSLPVPRWRHCSTIDP